MSDFSYVENYLKKMNVCIVNYNTQRLTDCAIRSINKHTPGCNIYVFDNSNKTPYQNTFSNVTIFDNTKGQIIDFDKWLKNYPNCNTSSGKNNGWASAKHCYTIEKCMELIPEGFVLMDSDILVKKDFSDIVDESCIFVGEIEVQIYGGKERVAPYICYINCKMCKENGVPYFDDNYMHGLKNTRVNPSCDLYDTGAAFYIHARQYKHKSIKFSEYVFHYKGGSWNDTFARRGGSTVESESAWLMKYRETWAPQNKKVIYTCISGNYDTLKDPIFLDENFDYICFTDQDLTSNVWQIRPLPDDVKDLSQVKKQRKIKVNPHLYLKDYEFSIWIDANVQITDNLTKYVEENCPVDKGVFFVGQHPTRDCVYDEGAACFRLHKDTKENIDKQLEGYRNESYPEHNGMVQTCVLLRYHNDPGCIKLDECWWKEIEAKSHRDQLSANYAFWRNQDVKVGILPKEIFKSSFFKLYPGHNSRKNSVKKQVEKDKPILRGVRKKRTNGIMF